MKTVTPIQREVLVYIHSQILSLGWPPSLREIAAHFGWTSTNACADHIRRLKKKELITTAPKIARGLKLTEKGMELL